jgi:CRISPR/Cas system CMR subunit Cmr4 (Cas7 group RAMP superfamily)
MIYLARFLVEARTPWHIGSGGEADFDQPVERDAFGVYRLPGSSLAGVLRSAAARRFSDDRAEEAFGGLNLAKSSAIWVSDGRLLDYDNAFVDEKLWRGAKPGLERGPYLRDHVRIAFETGAAKPGGKFDEEYVPVGARFFLELALDGWSGEPADYLREIFLYLAGRLQGGSLAFGGKSAEGFGQFNCLEAAVRRFDLASEAGLKAWLNLSSGPAPLFAEGEGEPVDIVVNSDKPDAVNISGVIKLPLKAKGPILVGGGDAAPGGVEADIVFYQEPEYDYAQRRAVWRKVIPGSSLRGVLRHRVYKAIRLLTRRDKPDIGLVNQIFGQAESKESRPGKIRVADVPLKDAPTAVVQHVAVDRFTGGALEGALYDEAPVWAAEGLTLELNLELLDLTDQEAALFFLALLDLAQGLTPVGAGGNRGQGFFQAEVEGRDLFDLITRHLDWPGRDKNSWLAELDRVLGEFNTGGVGNEQSV